jgi:hypothetical protein
VSVCSPFPFAHKKNTCSSESVRNNFSGILRPKPYTTPNPNSNANTYITDTDTNTNNKANYEFDFSTIL